VAVGCLASGGYRPPREMESCGTDRGNGGGRGDGGS